MTTIRRAITAVRRFKWTLISFRNYGARLNRAVAVEEELIRVANGKRGLLTPNECRDLAVKLGVPDCHRR